MSTTRQGEEALHTQTGRVDTTRIDYLVGGLRISIGPDSATPGPRSHIANFVGALREEGSTVDVLLASQFPGLQRFATIREGAAGKKSRAAILVSDLVRLGAAVWTGINVWIRSRNNGASIVYERAAVMQSMTSWHRKKSSAVRVVESNGLMSIETAADRGALVLTPVARAIERHVYRRADVVVAVSENLKNALIDFAALDPRRVLVVPNAMPAAAISTPLSASPVKTIGFAGAIVPWQQLDLLLAALSGLTDLDWRLEVVGDGPMLPGLIEQAERLAIADRVEWHGRLDQASTYSRMASWDVGYSGHKATHAAEMYHSPLKLYEYASFALECVCTASADAAALKSSGLSAHFFDDAVSLADALRSALRSSTTIDSRQTLRAELATDHDWNARARRVLDVCSSVAEQRSV